MRTGASGRLKPAHVTIRGACSDPPRAGLKVLRARPITSECAHCTRRDSCSGRPASASDWYSCGITRTAPGMAASAPAAWPDNSLIPRPASPADPRRPDPPAVQLLARDHRRARAAAGAHRTRGRHLRADALAVAARAATGSGRRCGRRPPPYAGITVIADGDGARRRTLRRVHLRPGAALRRVRSTACSAAGITGSRGHEGDNAGRTAIERLVSHERADHSSTFVFGCALFASAASDDKDLAVTLAEELYQKHARSIHEHTDRLFAGLMVVQWLAGIAAAYWISPRAWAGTTSQTHLHVWTAIYLGGLDHAAAGGARADAARPHAHAVRDRDDAGADVEPADSLHRRPHRDALPRVRLARVPLVLSRLARADPRHRGRGRRSLHPRRLLAAVGVRRGDRQPLALAGARRLGALRGRLPHRIVPAQQARDVEHRGAHGRAAQQRGALPRHRRARRGHLPRRGGHPSACSSATPRSTACSATTRTK